MQAINLLEEVTSDTSSTELLQLLAKIQMKARRWTDALDSLHRCLAIHVIAIFQQQLMRVLSLSCNLMPNLRC